MFKKILAIIMSLAITMAGTCVWAVTDFEADFTGSAANKPSCGFTWKIGGSMSKNRPALNAVNGAFGHEQDNMSVQILSATNVATSYQPYISADVSEQGEFSFGIKIASSDYNADKKVLLGIRDSNGDESEYCAAEMTCDGSLTVAGATVSASFDKEKWYGIEIETGSNKIYVNGEESGHVFKGDIAEVTYIKCMLSDKESAEDSADLWIDDIYLKSGSVKESSRIEISSDKLDIDYEGHTISSVPNGMTASEFLAAISTKYDEQLLLVSEDGTDYTDDTLKPGLYLLVRSKDGVNTMEYYIDLMGLAISGITNGEMVRNSSVSLTLKSNNADGIEYVEYYVNQKLVKTVYDEPYSLEYDFDEAGGYEFYAVAFVGEERISTPKVSVTYVPNKVPSVAIASPADNTQIGSGDNLEVLVEASDSDGEIASCELYYDEKVYKPENSDSPYKFIINNVSNGSHKIYAKAIDNDGGENTSGVITVTATKTGRRDILLNDFDKGTGNWLLWGDGSSASYIPVREDYGLSYAVNLSPAKVTQMVFDSKNGLLYTAPIVIECDFMMDKVANTTAELFIINSAAGEWYTIDTIRDGKLGAKTIKSDEWHHLTYKFNLKTKTAELYLDDELVTQASNITNSGSFNNVRIKVTNNNQNDEMNFYMDNVQIYAAMEYPYITSADFYNTAGTDIKTSDGKAKASLKQIALNFNTSLNPAKITSEQFKLYINGRKCEFFDVEYTENQGTPQVVLTLRSSAFGNAHYKIQVSGDIEDNFAQTIGSDIFYEFDTIAADLDVTKWQVFCNNREILQSSAIKKGDEIKVSADVVTKGAKDSALLIMAVYDGTQLIGCRIRNINPKTDKAAFNVSESFAVNDIKDSISVEGYLWSADALHSKSAYFMLGQ